MVEGEKTLENLIMVVVSLILEIKKKVNCILGEAFLKTSKLQITRSMLRIPSP